MHFSQKLILDAKTKPIAISFSKRDAKGVLAHENDHIVIKLQIHNWNVKCVLINLDSYMDILYWNSLKGMNMDPTDLLPFKGIK